MHPPTPPQTPPHPFDPPSPPYPFWPRVFKVHRLKFDDSGVVRCVDNNQEQKTQRPHIPITCTYSVTHATLLHLSLTGVYKSEQLLSQLGVGWTPVGHQVDLCFSWTSIGHQVDFCHLWTLDEDMLDVGWTPVGLLCLLDMRWTPVGHQMPDTCRREQRPLLEGIRPVSRSLSVLGSGDDLSSCYCSWWWWRWTSRTPTILWTTWVLWSVLSWLARREYHCWWWWTSTLHRKDSVLQLTWVLWSALNLPRLILIPSTPRALLTALNVWSAVKSEWLAIGVGNVLQWKVHSRHWHPALFLVKIHSAENLFFKIQSDENLPVKIQIQLSYTFREDFFLTRLTVPKNLSYFSQAAFSLNFGVKILSVCSLDRIPKTRFLTRIHRSAAWILNVQ